MDNDLLENYKNTLVIDGENVVIFRCMTFDEMDNYYVCQKLNGDFYETSAVGRLIFLKDQISNEDYDGLKYFFTINLARLNKEIL